MPDLKISQLPAASTPLAGTELVPVVQGGITEQTPVQSLLTSTVPSGTANGVMYLNGSKVATTGSGLTFDGTKLGVSVGTNTIAQQWQGAGTGFSLRLRSGDGSIQNSSSYRMSLDYLDGVANNGFIDFYRGGDGLTGYLAFGTSGTEKMRLDSSGNLGLGVTPGAWGNGFTAFQVKGPYIAANGYLNMIIGTNTAAGVDGGGSGGIYAVDGFATKYQQNVGAGQHRWFTAPSGTAGNAISFTQAMTLDASGNLLVGATANPGVLNKSVVVNSGADSLAGLVLQNNATGSGSTDGSHITLAGTELRIANAENAPTTFFNNGSERARITSGGSLYVGTTTSLSATEYRLQVVNSTSCALFQTADAAAFPVSSWNTATSGDNIFHGFFTEGGAGTSRGSIDYNRAGGLTRYNTTSDYRAKDIIGPVQNPGATIDALKVYEGKMKGATQSRPMLVAHEAQAVAPYAVSGVKDEVNEDGTPKFQQMDVSSLVPLLLAEIQSLRARVAVLESN